MWSALHGQTEPPKPPGRRYGYRCWDGRRRQTLAEEPLQIMGGLGTSCERHERVEVTQILKKLLQKLWLQVLFLFFFFLDSFSLVFSCKVVDNASRPSSVKPLVLHVCGRFMILDSCISALSLTESMMNLSGLQFISSKIGTEFVCKHKAAAVSTVFCLTAPPPIRTWNCVRHRPCSQIRGFYSNKTHTRHLQLSLAQNCFVPSAMGKNKDDKSLLSHLVKISPR